MYWNFLLPTASCLCLCTARARPAVQHGSIDVNGVRNRTQCVWDRRAGGGTSTLEMASPRHLRVVQNAEAVLRELESPQSGSPLRVDRRRSPSYRRDMPSPTLSASTSDRTGLRTASGDLPARRTASGRGVRLSPGAHLPPRGRLSPRAGLPVHYRTVSDERAHATDNDIDQPISAMEYTRDLEHHPSGNTSSLGLRAAVHSAHGQHAGGHAGGHAGASTTRHAPVTYVVAVYTGELTDTDRRQPWYQGLDEEQLVQLDRLGDELPHTQGEVCIELVGEAGKTSGYRKLLDAGPEDYHAFRKNSVDEFTLTCEYLGDIQAINITVDGTKVPPSDLDVEPWMLAIWKLEKVAVSCIIHTQRKTRASGWRPSCTCGSKPTGDHATKTGRARGTIWHFVPPPGQEWIGDKGTGDPQEVSHASDVAMCRSSEGNARAACA